MYVGPVERRLVSRNHLKGIAVSFNALEKDGLGATAALRNRVKRQAKIVLVAGPVPSHLVARQPFQQLSAPLYGLVQRLVVAELFALQIERIGLALEIVERLGTVECGCIHVACGGKMRRGFDVT
ncbi:hypothetical protein ACVWWG_007809 [Bradyrhizobium sp. LB7.2]